MKKLRLVGLMLCSFVFSCDLKLVAGNDKFGYINSIPEDSSFRNIGGIDIDSNGNLFVSDTYNNVIRKISIDGKVSTYAGTGKQGLKNGRKEDAEFYYNDDLIIDKEDNIFVLDQDNNFLRKIDAKGIVSSFELPKHDDIKNKFIKIKTLDEFNEFRIGNNNLSFTYTGSLIIGHIIFSNELKSINFKYYFDSGDLKENLADFETGLVGTDYYNKKMYFSYYHKFPDDGPFFTLPEPIRKFYEMDFVTRNVQDVTNKYTKSPYPSEIPERVYFDKENNMYLYHNACCISKTSKEGKFIKTYSLNFFSILFGNSNPIRSRFNFPPSNVVIDEKRKIFYFSDTATIYKFNI